MKEDPHQLDMRAWVHTGLLLLILPMLPWTAHADHVSTLAVTELEGWDRFERSGGAYDLHANFSHDGPATGIDTEWRLEEGALVGTLSNGDAPSATEVEFHSTGGEILLDWNLSTENGSLRFMLFIGDELILNTATSESGILRHEIDEGVHLLNLNLEIGNESAGAGCECLAISELHLPNVTRLIDPITWSTLDAEEAFGWRWTDESHTSMRTDFQAVPMGLQHDRWRLEYEGLESRDIRDDQTTSASLGFIVAGEAEGRLTLELQIESEPWYDYVEVILDGRYLQHNGVGDEQQEPHMASGWEYDLVYEAAVEPGEHVLEIRYTKDDSVADGCDCVTLKSLTIPRIEDFTTTGSAASFVEEFWDNGFEGDLGFDQAFAVLFQALCCGTVLVGILFTAVNRSKRTSAQATTWVTQTNVPVLGPHGPMTSTTMPPMATPMSASGSPPMATPMSTPNAPVTSNFGPASMVGTIPSPGTPASSPTGTTQAPSQPKPEAITFSWAETPLTPDSSPHTPETTLASTPAPSPVAGIVDLSGTLNELSQTLRGEALNERLRSFPPTDISGTVGYTRTTYGHRTPPHLKGGTTVRLETDDGVKVELRIPESMPVPEPGDRISHKVRLQEWVGYAKTLNADIEE